VQCAEVDDRGTIYTTAGAQVRSTSPVFAADAGTAGIWWISCAPYRSGVNPFCAAVDQNASGTIAWTTDPGDPGATWHQANHPGKTLYQVACQRAGVCVVNAGGTLFATTASPSAAAWGSSFKAISGLPGVATVSCTAAQCAAVGTSAGSGSWYLATSTGSGAWQTAAIPSASKLVEGVSFVACPSAYLCVLGNAYGQFVTATR
jgi:hypothetical protein